MGFGSTPASLVLPPTAPTIAGEASRVEMKRSELEVKQPWHRAEWRAVSNHAAGIVAF